VTVSDFLGNPEAKGRLSGFFEPGGRFPHAVLLEGLPGSGRKTLARLIAAAAVCHGAETRPCGACSDCHKSVGGIHPDIEELVSDKASFGVDLVRDRIRETAYILPNDAAYRVMILPEAQLMTEQAQNALLKVLEEPPSHLIFILTCENRTQMLPTVLSRTVCVPLSGVPEAEALPYLKTQMPQTDENTLRAALLIFDGRIGQVLEMNGDAFTRIRQLSSQMAAGVASPKELDLLRISGALAAEDKSGKELFDGVLGAFKLIIRDALVCRTGYSGRMSVDPAAAEKLGQTLPAPRLTAVMETVEQLQRDRLRNMNRNLLLTLMCSRLRNAAGY